jgi:Ulp1 family protease
MNNEVFDKAKVAEPLLVHLGPRDPVRRDLSANAAYALSKSFQNRTCIAVFKDEYFNANYNYKHVFAVNVNPTWADWQHYSMFIKSHQKQVVIAPQIRLLCASYAEVRNFQELMRSWSDALAPAYAIIQENKYYESQARRAEKGRQKPRSTRMRHGNVQYNCSSDSSSEDGIDTSLLQSVVPSQVFNSGPVLPDVSLDIQSLATLQPRKLLGQKVIEEYMSLLAQHFITTSFCPFLMDGWAWNALRSPSKNFTDHERVVFCRQYFQYLQSLEKPIVFAMNPWGNHWIALKIDMTKKYIATACSLNNAMDQLAQGVLKMISVHHKPASTFEHIIVKVPHQRNAEDCGPLSCLFLLFLAHNDITRSTTLDYDSEFTAVAMRLRIAADICNKKLTPLVAQ